MNRISNSIPAAASRKPALDFIRIVFCLMVVCEHYLVPAPPSGAIAVIGFCVMSGFWIGPLLERKELDVVSFYRGKARRLLPLLGLALLSVLFWRWCFLIMSAIWRIGTCFPIPIFPS